MKDLALRTRGLGKMYRIGGERREANTLRDAVVGMVKRPLERIRHPGAATHVSQVLWALKDVSIDVVEGEVLGVIGRNGAGKSTLLKVLSRITDPTEGKVEIRGRVASLLEVGTGFHSELTGRENIHLSSAILGMSRADTRRRFDEIVEFSEIGRFLDTPVKRYSSGMYVRLAFAVAAHLEPEILVVDEVLAVGDEGFQRKCLGKMNDVAHGGRTIVFVSHNMSAVRGLCSRAVLLEQGMVQRVGPVDRVIDEYLERGRGRHREAAWTDLATAPGNDRVRITGVSVTQPSAGANGDLVIDDEVRLHINYVTLLDGLRVTASIHLLDSMGAPILASGNMASATRERDPLWGIPVRAGCFRATCTVPPNLLNDGVYHVTALVLSDVSRVEARVDNAISFTLHDSGGMRKEYFGPWIGVVRPKLEWITNQGELPGIQSDNLR